jgi:hypothetical protein
MPVLYPNGAVNLSDVNGFYEVEAYNLGSSYSTGGPIVLTTTRYQSVTFANACNCTGLVLVIATVQMTDRALDITLEQIQTVTSFDTATEKINKVSHGLLDNDIVTFTSTGTLPTGITANSRYYVINKTANDFQISTSLGGSVQALSGTPSGTATVGVQRTTQVFTADQVAGSISTGSWKYRGTYFRDFKFSTPYAVDTTATKWRFRIAHGSGTGSWSLYTSDGTNMAYGALGDNAKSFANGDVMIFSDYVAIDQSATLGAVLGTGDATIGYSAYICSNITDPTPDNVSYMKWAETPAAAYTLTVGGRIIHAMYSGVRIGREDVTLSGATTSIASPCKVGYTAHGLTNGQRVKLTTTGALPTGITAGTTYYVVNKTDNDFEIEATVGGGAINTSGSQSGVHTCTNIRRIPVAQKATITFTAPAVGTATAAFFQTSSSATYVYGGGQSQFFYGEIPAYAKTNLTNDEEVGQTVLTCDDAVDWVNGDSVVIGKQNTQGQGVTTIHAVDSVSGNDITLTGALATNKRMAGATVLRLGGYGIRLQNTSTYSTNYIGSTANMNITGVELFNWAYYGLSATTQYYYTSSIPALYKSKHVIEDCVTWTDNNSPTYLFAGIVPEDGIEFNRVYGFRRTISTAMFGYFSNGFYSGTHTVKNCAVLMLYTSAVGAVGNANCTNDIHDNVFENARSSTPFLQLIGINSSFYNNYCWGNATASSGAMSVGQCINPVRIENNQVENNAIGLSFEGNVSTNCIDTGMTFGPTANTVDIFFAPGGLHDYTMDTPTGISVLTETYLTETLEGNKVSIMDYNGTAKDDRAWFTYGKTHRCHSTLTDTAVHTAGGSADGWQAISGTNRHTESIDIPTGNLNGLGTYSVGIWVRINKEAYWAGTYELPKLTVTYDTSSTVTATALQVASDTAGETADGWRYITVDFTPITDAGSITVTKTIMSDASGTDAYVSWDDYGGGSLVNNLIDLWKKGRPEPPVWSFLMQGKDFWTASSLITYGSGTMGETLIEISDEVL